MGFSLGKKIREIRINKGLSMEEFGKLINGANRGLVSKWENDKSVPGIARLHLIANLGGISIDQLLTTPKTKINLSEVREISDNLQNSSLFLDRLEDLNYNLKKLTQKTLSTKNIDFSEYEDISKEFSRIIQTLEIYEFKNSVLKAQKVIEEFTLRKSSSNEGDTELENKYKQLMLPGFDEIESMEKEEDANIEVDTSINIQLEEIFSLNSNLSLNNHSLSPEEKQKALKILELIFTK